MSDNNVPSIVELLTLANEALTQARFQEADSLALKVLLSELDNEDALLIRAQAQELLGVHRKAKIFYAQVGQLTNSPDAYARAAMCHMQLGEMKHAASYFDKAIANERDPEVLARLALLRSKLEE